MTPFAKILLGFSTAAIVVAGTLALRSTAEPARHAPTPSQLAAFKAAIKEEPRPAPVAATKSAWSDAGDQTPPEEPEIEDGSGS
jgi:hypothetical protein